MVKLGLLSYLMQVFRIVKSNYCNVYLNVDDPNAFKWEFKTSYRTFILATQMFFILQKIIKFEGKLFIPYQKPTRNSFCELQKFTDHKNDFLLLYEMELS